MQDLDLVWLLPTVLQVIGLAVGLGVLGLAYERAVQEQKSFAAALEQGHEIRWLALAGVIFAAGMLFTHTGWVYKAAAIALAVLLIALAWTSPGRKFR
jgi:hypothetical protein